MSDSLQKKIENRIIDCINKSARGRLIVFRFREGIGGADLVVKKKGEYKQRSGEEASKTSIVKAKVFGKGKQGSTKEIFLRVRRDREKKDVFDTAGSKDFYIIFVSFDTIKQDISDDLCIVRLEDKKEFSINKKDLSKFLLNNL